MGVQADVDIRPDGLSQRAEPRTGVDQGSLPRHGPPVGTKRAGLEGREPLFFNQLAPVFCEFLRGFSPDSVVGADAVPDPAAEQLVDGNAAGLAGDVPQ